MEGEGTYDENGALNGCILWLPSAAQGKLCFLRRRIFKPRLIPSERWFLSNEESDDAFTFGSGDSAT